MVAAPAPAPAPALAPVLWLCGPTGVGKSAVAWEIYVQVVRSGVRAGYVDLAQVGFCLPAPAGDPHNHRVKAGNVGALWTELRAAGARCLVLSGDVDRHDTISLYRDALPDTVLTLCRLRAGRASLLDRIARRARGEPPALPGDPLIGRPVADVHRLADRAARDGEDLARAGVGDPCVDTDGAAVEEVARQVRDRAGGWPALHPTVHDDRGR